MVKAPEEMEERSAKGFPRGEGFGGGIMTPPYGGFTNYSHRRGGACPARAVTKPGKPVFTAHARKVGGGVMTPPYEERLRRGVIGVFAGFCGKKPENLRKTPCQTAQRVL